MAPGAQRIGSFEQNKGGVTSATTVRATCLLNIQYSKGVIDLGWGNYMHNIIVVTVTGW